MVNSAIFSFSAALGFLFADSMMIYISSSGIVMSSCITFDVLFPYTCELYGTRIRGLSIGFHNTIARLFTIIAPLTMVAIVDLSTSYLFGFLTLLGAISLLVGVILPADKKEYNLDL